MELEVLKSKRKQSGAVLLLEVVIGFGIFVSAILLMFGLFTSSQRATVSSKNLMIAGDLAKEVMETELIRGFGGVSNQAATDILMPTLVDGDPDKPEAVNYTTFVSQVQVFPESATDPPFDFRRKRVLVTISWREVNGVNRKTQLETYLVE